MWNLQSRENLLKLKLKLVCMNEWFFILKSIQKTHCKNKCFHLFLIQTYKFLGNGHKQLSPISTNKLIWKISSHVETLETWVQTCMAEVWNLSELHSLYIVRNAMRFPSMWIKFLIILPTNSTEKKGKQLWNLIKNFSSDLIYVSIFKRVYSYYLGWSFCRSCFSNKSLFSLLWTNGNVEESFIDTSLPTSVSVTIRYHEGQKI